MAGTPGAGETGPGDVEELDTDLEVDPDEDQEAEGDGEDAEDGVDDAEAEGDGGGDDAEGNEAQGQARNVAPPARRSEGRYQRLANENRELKSKVSTFERQLGELIQQRNQPSPAEVARLQAEEAARVELMSPAEVAAYYAQKTENTIRTELQRDRAVLFDRADRNEFDQIIAGDPTLRKFTDKVEEYRQQAPGVPRRLLLATAIGEQALAQRSTARTRGNNRAEAQRTRQTVRAPSGRGDVVSDRRRSGGSLDDRLRGQVI